MRSVSVCRRDRAASGSHDLGEAVLVMVIRVSERVTRAVAVVADFAG